MSATRLWTKGQRPWDLLLSRVRARLAQSPALGTISYHGES